MTWLPLDSKMLTSVAYEVDQQILYLRFRTGGDVYRYFEFSPLNIRRFSTQPRGRFSITVWPIAISCRSYWAASPATGWRDRRIVSQVSCR